MYPQYGGNRRAFFLLTYFLTFPWPWGQASPCLAAGVRAGPAYQSTRGQADSHTELAPTLPRVVGTAHPASYTPALSRVQAEVRTLCVALLTLRRLDRPTLSAVPVFRAAHSGSSGLPLFWAQWLLGRGNTQQVRYRAQGRKVDLEM